MERGKIKFYRQSPGFTLIELLVVVSIVGLLASIVMVSLGHSQAKARDAKRLNDMKQIRTGLELYYAAGLGYPDETVWNVAQATGSLLSCGDNDTFRVPNDMIPTKSYDYEAGGTSQSGCGSTVWSEYSLQFQTEQETELGPAGTYYLWQNGFSPCDPLVC